MKLVTLSVIVSQYKAVRGVEKVLCSLHMHKNFFILVESCVHWTSNHGIYKI